MPRLILSAAITAAFTARALADPGLAAAIRDHAAGQEQRSATLKCRSRETEYNRDGKLDFTIEFHTQTSRQFFRQENISIEGNRIKPGLYAAVGMTSRYYYALKRVNDAWVMTQMGAPLPGKKRNIYPMEYGYASSLIDCSYSALLSDAHTRIVAEKTVEWRGRSHQELVVDVQLPHGGDPNKNMARRRYGLFVLPEQPGIVRGVRDYDPANLSQWLLEEVIDYQPGDDPFPVVKTVDTFVTDKTAGYEPWLYWHNEVIECSRSREPSPERAFSLTTFGLPEPRTIPKPPRSLFSFPMGDINMMSKSPFASQPPPGGFRYWLWVFIGLAVLLAAGSFFFCRWYRNKTA